VNLTLKWVRQKQRSSNPKSIAAAGAQVLTEYCQQQLHALVMVGVKAQRDSASITHEW
jgi:hypothetical protein